MMLSRTAQNLYWIGRYMERAEFTTRLVEATIRLDSLSANMVDDESAWISALAVVGESDAFDASGGTFDAFSVTNHLMLADQNSNSVRSCLRSARDNARAARNAITSEAWEAINRAWLDIRDRTTPGGSQAATYLVETLKADTRGFEGALARMLRSESYWFLRLGAVIERYDNTARLLDVKYYLILPEGEQIGGTLDRDQWTTILQTVSARNAYRALYRDTLKPWLVADLLVYRQELPRSLAASAAEAVELLTGIGEQTGRQGEADRLARQRLGWFDEGDITSLFQSGLHEALRRCIHENAALHQAIAQQFRFA